MEDGVVNRLVVDAENQESELGETEAQHTDGDGKGAVSRTVPVKSRKAAEKTKARD